MGRAMNEKEIPRTKEEMLLDWKLESSEQQRKLFMLYNCERSGKLDTVVSFGAPLITKLCYVINGMPDSDKEQKDIFAIYFEEKYQKQLEQAIKFEEIFRKALEMKDETELNFITIFIYFYLSAKEASIWPVFKIHKVGDDRYKLVDLSERIYENPDDWLKHNTLPVSDICYPNNFSYKCDNISYLTDMESLVTFGKSGNSKLSKGFAIADIATAGVALGTGCLAFTPLGPIMAAGAVGSVLTSVGIGGMLYGGTRSAYRLFDKKTHGESLATVDSISDWATIILSPIGVAAGAARSALIKSAREGIKISQTTKTATTILSGVNISCQGAMLFHGGYNLFRKYKKNDLSTLDVLQFSLSIFFFTNQVLQPIRAEKLIYQAQEQRFLDVERSFNSDEAKAGVKKLKADNFDNANNDNRRSKVIRTLNKTGNEEDFYKGISKYDKVRIVGRKGGVVELSGGAGKKTNPVRVEVNKVLFSSGNNVKEPHFSNNYHTRMQNVFGDNYEDLKYLKNLSEADMQRVDRVLSEAVKSYDVDIIRTAVKIADALKVNTFDDFLAIIENLACDLKEYEKDGLSDVLPVLRTTGFSDYLKKIKLELENVEKLISTTQFNFGSLLCALYRFKQLGSELSANSLQSYLLELPKKFLDKAYLLEVDTATGTRFYENDDGTFGIVRSVNGRDVISAIFKCVDKYGSFMKYWKTSELVDLNLSPATLLGYVTTKYSFYFRRCFRNTDPSEIINKFSQEECQAVLTFLDSMFKADIDNFDFPNDAAHNALEDDDDNKEEYESETENEDFIDKLRLLMYELN